MSVNQQLSQPAQGLVNLDQYYPQVGLLLHMDGSNGSTTFTDSSLYPKTVSAIGAAQVSTTQSKFGNGSGYFDGSTTAYLSTQPNTDFNLGNNNFTFEMWIFPVATGARCLFAKRSSGWSTGDYLLSINLTDGSIAFYSYEYDPGGSVPVIGATGLTINTWQHVAVQRNGTLWSIYRNGVLLSSGTKSNITFINNSLNFSIGQDDSPFFDAYNGYMNDFRFTKGVARYTTNFNPPAAPFPDNSYSKVYSDPYYSSVSLLLHGDGSNGGTTFTDNSRFTRTPSAVSNTVTSATQKKFGVTSIYFAGSSSNPLRYASSSDFNISGVDFTIELWFYRTGGQSALLCRRDPGISGFTSGWVLNTSGIRANINGVWSDVQITWADPGLNTWNHIAWTVSGTTMSVFLNGVLVGTKTSVTSINDTAATLDFAESAAGGENLYQGFIDDFRFTRGVARYTSNFTPPAAPHPNLPAQGGWVDNIYADQWYGNTSLLLHCDGANSGTTFRDSSPQANTVTANGNAVTSTAATKWGPTSAYFDGTGDYLSIPYSDALSFNSANFTIEGWARYSSSMGAYGTLVDLRGSSAVNSSWGFFIDKATRAFVIYDGPTGLNTVYTDSNAVPVADVWFHWAIVRNGTTTAIYIDGTVIGATASATYNPPATAATGIRIGINQSAGSAFFGFMDDVRFTKGVARYTAAFTPPAAPFANLSPPGWDPFYQRTSLLLHMDGANGGTTFTDNSPVPKTVTPSGGATTSTAVVKYGGSSLLVDATTKYLSISNSTDIDMGSSDFTVEFWLYFTTWGTSAVFVSKRTNNSVDSPILIYGNSTNTFLRFTNSSSTIYTVTGAALATSTWHHIAAVRLGNNIYLYINGSQSGSSATISGSALSNSSALTIGNEVYQPGTAPTTSTFYIDELRITKGVARYTANFQPPPGPFPNR